MVNAKRKITIAGFLSLYMTLASCVVRAETTLHLQAPGAKTTVGEAKKAAKAGKTVYKCNAARLSDSGGAAKKSGAKITWHTSRGEHETAADDAMDDGKTVYKCVGLVWDAERRKLVNE